MHSFKYEKSERAMQMLCSILVDSLIEIIGEALITYPKEKIIVTFVPSTTKRTRERGYNHLVKIAQCLEKKRDTLYRNTYTHKGGKKTK